MSATKPVEMNVIQKLCSEDVLALAKQKAIECVSAKNLDNQTIASTICDELNKQFDPSWACVVGTDFGA